MLCGQIAIVIQESRMLSFLNNKTFWGSLIVVNIITILLSATLGSYDGVLSSSIGLLGCVFVFSRTDV